MKELVSSKRTASWVRTFLSLAFWVRTVAFALVAYLAFGLLLQPIRIRGGGMAPTYRHGSINFFWRGRYWFSPPRPFHVVSVRPPGSKTVLVRRVVASEGDSVSFYRGRLIVNERPVEEAYVKNPCRWTMWPVRVTQGHVFVVGDNRDMPIQEAMIGEVPVTHILGAPLW